MRSKRTTTWMAVLAAAVVTASVVAGIGPASATGVPQPLDGTAPVPTLNWAACADPSQAGFQCATAVVPLDYSNPYGQTIKLAVIRHVAQDPSSRAGTLFFNPGGPAGAGTVDLPAFYDFFPAGIRAAYDIVSWDPRGVGSSTAVQCYSSLQDEMNQFTDQQPAGFPVGPAEQQTTIANTAKFTAQCGAQVSHALLAHVSTADSARDLNLLREAVGDQSLTYLGVSYGTLLGATYANLFPSKVKAMVLDGNLDPEAWFTPSSLDGVRLDVSLRIKSDIASASTLKSLVTLCGQAPVAECPFAAGTSPRPGARNTTTAKFAQLLARFRAGPITAQLTPPGGTPQTVTFTYAAFLDEMAGLLFTVQPEPGFLGWNFAGQLMQDFWVGSSAPATAGPAAAPGASASTAPAVSASSTYAGPEQLDAILCSETPNPPAATFPAIQRVAQQRGYPIGPDTLWADLPCATWPVQAAAPYTGPWNLPRDHTILVIGNTGDPATYYGSSVNMVRDLGNARLLTVDGFGHTTLLNPSTCANNIETSYFLDGTLPPIGTVCQQDVAPFASPAG